MGVYHDILEIEDTATEADITAAFRKLAKKYHPDANHGGTDEEKAAAEAKFKEINEAVTGLKEGRSGPIPEGQRGGFNDWGRNPMDDLKASFNNFYGAHHQTIIHETLGVPLEIFVNGGVYKYAMRFGNNVISKEIDLKPDTPVGTSFIVETPENPNVKINVSVIPVSNTIEIHGINIAMRVNINAFEAIVGTTRKIGLPTNKEIEVTIPAGTPPSALLRIAGKGLLNINNQRGDLFIKIEVHIPELSDDHKERIKEIMAQTGIN